MRITGGMTSHKHEWEVYSTAIADVCIMVRCGCGAVGNIPNGRFEHADWNKAFRAPSEPYPLREELVAEVVVSQADMELGNALFGNSRGESLFPRDIAWESPFFNLLAKCGLDSKYCLDKNDKRGFENDVFKVEPYFWGDCDCPQSDDDIHVEDCPTCAPNFLHKASGFRIEWYKYPFRNSYMTPTISLERWREIMDECLSSV